LRLTGKEVIGLGKVFLHSKQKGGDARRIDGVFVPCFGGRDRALVIVFSNFSKGKEERNDA